MKISTYSVSCARYGLQFAQGIEAATARDAWAKFVASDPQPDADGFEPPKRFEDAHVDRAGLVGNVEHEPGPDWAWHDA